MKQTLTALAIALAVGFSGLGQSTAEAGGYHGGFNNGHARGYAGYHAPVYKPHCHYKAITTYVYKEIPVVKYFVKYLPCGTPYKVKKVFYKSVKVPVVKYVKVCH